MSRRDYFAGQILGGMWANPTLVPADDNVAIAALRGVAIQQADALLEELDGQKGE